MKRIILLLVTLFLLAACGQLNGDVLTIRTADPAVSVAFLLLPAPPVTILPVIAPPDCVLKGNISTQGEKIVHSPGQNNYNNTVIDESKGEKMFCTLEEAIAEGWRAAKN